MACDRPPDDLILQSLTWLREEVFTPEGSLPHLVTHPLEDRDIAVWLCGINGYMGQWEKTNPGDAPLTRHSNAQHATYGAIEDVVHPPDPGTHPAPLEGRLTVSGDTYRDSQGPRLPIFVHAGDLIGHALTFGVSQVIPYLDLFQKAGYHGIRSWVNVEPHPWWADKPVPSWNILNNPPLFEDLVRECRQRHLMLHLASGGLASLSHDRQRAMFGLVRDVMGRVGSESLALIEGCNEARDTTDPGDESPEHLESLVGIVRQAHPQVLGALTAYTGTEDRAVLEPYTTSWMPHSYLHGYRGGHAWDKIRHVFSWTYEDPLRPFAWQGEPVGPGRLVSVTENKQELDGPTMALLACMAAMCQQVWTFMSGPGVVLTDEPFESMPGFYEGPSALRHLPQDLMTYQTRGHGGDTWAASRIHKARGEVRCDFSRHADGRYCEIVYGPPEQLAQPLEQVVQTTDVLRIVNGRFGYVETGRTV